jgi:hypothetical protein
MTDETGRKKAKYKKPRQISRDYGPIFTNTLESYLESRFLIDIGNIPANNPDPAAKRPMKLTTRAEHCADVEKAIRTALKQDNEQECFEQMLREMAQQSAPDLAFPLGLRVDVIQKVGRQFQQMRVAPWLYFQGSLRR